MEKILGDGILLRSGILLFAYNVNSKKGTSSRGFDLSKGAFERVMLARLTIKNKSAFNQVVPDLGLEERTYKS